MAKEIPLKKLSDQEEMWCLEYIKDFNAYRSALAAGYTENTAKSKSCSFIKRLHIRARVDALLADRKARLKIDGDEIRRRWLRIADAAESQGKFNDALRSLELLAKDLGMLNDKSEIDITMRNPFSSGADQDAIERDLAHLMKVIGKRHKNAEKTTSDTAGDNEENGETVH